MDFRFKEFSTFSSPEAITDKLFRNALIPRLLFAAWGRILGTEMDDEEESSTTAAYDYYNCE